MAEEQVAVIRNVEMGLREGRLCLSFRTYISPSRSALQEVLNPEVMEEYLRAYHVRKVEELDGRPIWVEVSSSEIRVTRPCTTAAWNV